MTLIWFGMACTVARRAGYFFALNTSRSGTADCPLMSLKLPNFALFTQIAYVLFGSSFTGSTLVRLSAKYMACHSFVESFLPTPAATVPPVQLNWRLAAHC
jgi:hypothetical protein